jgi:DDE superfamily endonuclease
MNEREQAFSKLDYCQFLLSSQVNYTLTHMADHLQSFSHDTINRYLRGEKLSPRLLWEQVQPHLALDENAYLVFDDTVLDHNHGPRIEMVRRQWSGNQKRVITGIGLVSCVYVNSTSKQFWVIDYRIFDPQGDGKGKLDHVREMLAMVLHRQLPFKTVLMDAWYAAKEVMLQIAEAGKTFYCPLKTNRLVDDTKGAQPYRRIEALEWSETELATGKIIKLRGFPGDFRVKLFRVEVSTHRTEWVVTNDLSQDTTQGAQQVSAVRWKIEEFHREAKQLTGLEGCQCRKARIQRNHIACALLVWSRLKSLAYQLGRTVYQIKRGLLHDYLIQQLKSPSIKMVLA